MTCEEPLDGIPPENAEEKSSCSHSGCLHSRLCRLSFSPWSLAALALVLLAFLAVLVTGLLADGPMLGDEVTHYYLAAGNAESFPEPTCFARVPAAFDENADLRCYPHPVLWHYLGGVVFRLSGGSFRAVQLYHSLYWLQLLCLVFIWARSMERKGTSGGRGTLLSVLGMATLPMAVIFSVSMYLDVPVTAQVTTAFYLLMWRKRYVWASLFMGFALLMKVPAFVFLPPFLLILGWGIGRDFIHSRGAVRWRLVLTSVVSLCILGGTLAMLDVGLKKYAHAQYYPTERLANSLQNLRHRLAPSDPNPEGPVEQVVNQSRHHAKRAQYRRRISNNPGDLRQPKNFFIYGGLLLWPILLGGVGSWLLTRFSRPKEHSPMWDNAVIFGVGVFYVLVTAWQLRPSPDARFFLPALPFLLIPAGLWAGALFRWRWLLCSMIAAGLLQGGAVLHKTAGLRALPEGIQECIDFLRTNPPSPRTIFMYPDGNYRLFPCPHEWYLGYQLQHLWRGDNDERIALLQKRKIGAVVIKKSRVGPIDREMHNLGVYPDFFVEDLRRDKRFVEIFDNSAVTIYRVP